MQRKVAGKSRTIIKRPTEPKAYEFHHEMSQEIIGQFKSIVRKLWPCFQTLNDPLDHIKFFKEVLPFLAKALGAKDCFLAERFRDTNTNKAEKYKVIKWLRLSRNKHTTGESEYQEIDKYCRIIRSDTLCNAECPKYTGIINYGNKNISINERGPLKRILGMLSVARLSIGDGKPLFIGFGFPLGKGIEDGKQGTRNYLINYLLEIMALPLRFENEGRKIKILNNIYTAGYAKEVIDVALDILRPRVNLAWTALDIAATKYNRKRPASPHYPPEVSGTFDGILAHYLDAERYLAAIPEGDFEQESKKDGWERLASLLEPEKSSVRVVLPKDPNTRERKYEYLGDNNEPEVIDIELRNRTLALAPSAHLSRHAVARTMLWLSYKSGALPGGATEKPKCCFAEKVHAGCDGISENRFCKQVFIKYTREPDIPPEESDTGESEDEKDPLRYCPYASRLRTLWMEIYYRARQVKEKPGPDTDRCLGGEKDENGKEIHIGIAGRYIDLAKKTSEYLQKALNSLQIEDIENNTRHPHIEWRWLYLWFLSKALDSPKLNERYGEYDKAKHGVEGHVHHYMATSAMTLFGLHLLQSWESETIPEFWDVPESRPHDLSEARVYLLCEYAHREIGVENAWMLEHHLNAQFQSEMVLYGSSPSHRDHVFHVIDVCLLGHLLIESRNRRGGQSSISKAVVGDSKDNRKTKSFLRKWYPAALLHDVGVALALSKRLPGLLKRFSSPDLKAYTKDLQERIEATHEALDKKILKQLEDADLKPTGRTEGISYDHGFVSVNHLIHSITKALGKKDLPRKNEFREVLHAILRHHRSEETVNTKKEPLSYFLVLCDHLHEWGRSRVRPAHMARALLSAFQMHTPMTAEAEHSVRYLVPKAEFKNVGSGGNVSYRLVFPAGTECEFSLHYSPSRARLQEPACQWVDIWASSERVIVPPGFPKIRIGLVHPQSDTLRRTPYAKSEMQYLREYSMTEQGAFLRNWLSEYDNNRLKDEMDYTRKDKTTGSFVETFRLRYGREKDERLLAYIPEDFYTEFFAWKERKLGLAPDDN